MVLTPQPSLPASSPAPLFEEMDCVATGEHAAMLLPATALPLLVPLHVGVKTSGRILHNSGNTSPSSGKFVGDPHILALSGELEGDTFDGALLEGDCEGDSN